MTVRYITLVGTDDARKELRDTRVEHSLKAMQAEVEGLIEVILDGPGFTAWGNEEGKLVGLPHNYSAEWVLLKLGWTPWAGDFIVGNILFTGDVDASGNTTSLSDAVAKQILDLYAAAPNVVRISLVPR